MYFKIVYSILILFLSLYLSSKWLDNKSNKKVDWIIGILSKPENFENRIILRNTWFNYIDELQNEYKIIIKPYFIIGKELCDLTENEKIDLYSCEKLNLNNSNKTFLTLGAIQKLNNNTNYQTIKSFLFTTSVNIQINKLGLANCILKKNEKFLIFLIDADTQEIITKVDEKENFSYYQGYIYFDLKNLIVLKKNFTGILLLNYNEENESCKNFKTNFHETKVLKYKLIEKNHELNHLTGNDLFLISLQYTLYKSNEINSNDKNLNKKNVHRIKEQINQEINLYDDILLVDNLDTYRNLTSKLLNFINIISKKYDFDYFLKTDDDTFLNLKQIVRQIKGDGYFWFGKKNWVVNKDGKWSESNYQSFVYPPFACGSAYVLTKKITDWINLNKNYLFNYQGEDVSMGIWLTSILPIYVNDKKWNCDNSFINHFNSSSNSNFFSLGQLSTNELVKIYKKAKIN